MASLNQIEKGLIKEAMEQLRLAMGNLEQQRIALKHLAEIKKELNEAQRQQNLQASQNNIRKTWQDLIAKAQVPDSDAPLGEMKYYELGDFYAYKEGGILLDPN